MHNVYPIIIPLGTHAWPGVHPDPDLNRLVVMRGEDLLRRLQHGQGEGHDPLSALLHIVAVVDGVETGVIG